MMMTLMRNFMAAAAALAVCALCAPARADLLVSADTNAVSFGTARIADLDRGFIELSPSSMSYDLRISVQDTGPVDWTITMRADSEYFMSDNSSDKPCGDLLWRVNGTGGYAPATTLDENMVSGTGDAILDYDFILNTGWEDAPGRYGLTVVFTIVEN
jgi:hypothetical protein